jgi:hypothetical protein
MRRDVIDFYNGLYMFEEYLNDSDCRYAMDTNGSPGESVVVDLGDAHVEDW